MRYSLGCAFNLSDIIYNFPFKSLEFTCNDAKVYTGDYHRDDLVRKIFLYGFRLIIEDIVNNNVTFDLPLVGSRKCNIHMKRYTGLVFKNMRKYGKWKDVDILSSYFSGYLMSFYMGGNRTPRVKSIYLDKYFRDKITENTNKGMSYGDSKTNTTIKDYLPKVCEQFPIISKKDIERILKYCWRSVYLCNSYGGDSLIRGKNIWCYIGNLKRDPLKHFHYYIRKLTIKLQVLYKRKKIKWDGYYYFALTEPLYLNYLSQKNSRGRKRKHFNYGNICLYLIKDECLINEFDHRYIFKVPYLVPLKFKHIVYNFKSDNAELILIREPLKFKDILVDNVKYDIL